MSKIPTFGPTYTVGNVHVWGLPNQGCTVAQCTPVFCYVSGVTWQPPLLLLLPLLLPPLPVPPGSFDGLVMVWDIGTGQPLHTYKGHQYQVTAVALLPTGDIASASVDK